VPARPLTGIAGFMCSREGFDPHPNSASQFTNADRTKLSPGVGFITRLKPLAFVSKRRNRQADYLHNLCHDMPCRIRCNECDLDRWLEDCVTAHKQAKEHEAQHTDHWITLHDPPDYVSDPGGE